MKLGLLLLFFGHAYALQLPSHWKRCQVSPELDNKRNDCLKEAIEDVGRDLALNGNKAFGLENLDPLLLDTIAVSHGNGPLAINLTVSQGSVEGYKRMKVLSVRGKLSSPKDFALTFKVKIDEIVLKGVYDVSGKVLILPITGHGYANMTLKSYTGKMTFFGQPKIKSDGKEYLKITGHELDYDVGGLIFRVDNLFNGNKQLGEIMNTFLNDNWYEFHLYARPETKKIFGNVFTKHAKKILENVPFNEIFLTS